MLHAAVIANFLVFLIFEISTNDSIFQSRGLWIDEDGMTPSSSSEVLKPAASLADSFTLRKLKPYDRIAVETLCNESFPIQYPDFWYDEVVSGGLTSTGLFDGENLAAMIVSETKFVTDCNLEDQDIISESNVHVLYSLHRSKQKVPKIGSRHAIAEQFDGFTD